ncbi:MAG: ATP-binding cassette domain-containing protein [Flammeovirgaceae bacterium]
MNQRVLFAIIRLLAIIGKINKIDEKKDAKERTVIAKFLNDNLGELEAEDYMNLFDKELKKASSNIEETRRIIDKLQKRLNDKQRTIVLLTVSELMLADGELMQQEDDILKIICEEFSIPTEQLKIIQQFLLAKSENDIFSSQCLIINGKKELSNTSQDNFSQHLYKEGMQSTLVVLWLPFVNMYYVRLLNDNDYFTINGNYFSHEHSYPLTVGSIIKSDNNHDKAIIFYSDIVSYFYIGKKQEKITFEAKNIFYYFRKNKVGLNDINISEESGRLIAIMGASGSGKSTLLSVLNGNLNPQKGQVLINGIDIHKENNKIKGVIGYVPQDDLLIEELTVYENLFFASKLCFANKSEEELHKLVEKTLENLGLYEAKDLKVGNALNKTISGGQRKRLNIGLELLREPSVMFVDEPTSGLSSQDSENILDLLRELALTGKLIFVVIHQPSSDLFKMFDKLLILDVGGYPIYYGNPVEAISYFKRLAGHVDSRQGACSECGNVNPEQIFEIIERKVIDELGRPTKKRKTLPEKWHKYYQRRIKLPKVITSNSKIEVTLNLPTLFEQFLIFTKRDFLSKVSNKQYLIINLLQAPLLAIILSLITRFYNIDELKSKGEYIFYENLNIPSYIFMSVIVSLFMGLTVSAEEIIKDAKIRKRESFLHLSKSSYLLSKMIILFTLSAIQSLLFVWVGNTILGINGLYGIYWAVLFSTSCFANLLGLNISATFNSVITIYILIPILLIPQLILGGIVVNYDHINPIFINKKGKVPLVGEMMASRWAFEALVVSQFKDNLYEREYFDLDKQIAVADYKRIYFYPTLLSKLEACLEYKSKDNINHPDYLENLQILNHELSNEMKKNSFVKFTKLDILTPKTFDILQAEELKKEINTAKNYYVLQYNRLSNKKDNIIAEKIKTKEGKKQYQDLMNQNHNKKIEDLVLNLGTDKRIVEYNDRLIQKIYPIYQEPYSSNIFDFRSHFFAHTKQLFGYQIPTLYFNIGVIWVMLLVLYVTLYYEVFKKILNSWSNWKKMRNKE